MMGAAVGRLDRLFYSFNLEDRVPGDHLLRRIKAVLGLGWLRGELAPFYSHTGCPSVDPELLMRMLPAGYCYSIRSERRLRQEVERTRRPVREYLAALDGDDAPTNPERAPEPLSPTDPSAAWTTRGRHKVMFG